ncbi:MAG: polysaccharide biosynthesis protein [Burkholderiaceae bacterium]|nr:polysaccharide biosynthesis protein [Burkholderiaceae bacterium]
MFWLSLDAFLTRIRRHREPLSLVLDGLAVALAWQATYLFRLGFDRWISARPRYDIWVMLGLVLLYVLVLWLLRVPRGMWRFSGFGEVKRLLFACLIAGSLGTTVVLMAELKAVPRAVLALHPVFCVIVLAMTRMGYRMLYEHMRSRISGGSFESHRVLVLGAGHAAQLLLAGIQHQGWVVVGLLDDDPSKREARAGGIPVLGGLGDVGRLAELHGITHVIVAMPSASPKQRRRALDLAAGTGLHVLTVPSSAELMSGSKPEQLRDVEPEDLLGREPVQLDEAGISEAISGKVVLITGAGGSIGSELCRQLARFGPKKIVLYELSEVALYQVEQELTEQFPRIPLVRLIGDVKDLAHLSHTFARLKPQVVFHAAAYKHVPLMEEENAWAALRNNTLGTYHAALAAAEAGAERFVLISTDKAVNPTNVMGATKRAAELVISHLSSQGHATRFMAVRFGNVLGSSGSVIPKFKEQIAKGGPVTVTHPDITRYFMTIPEAARLVVQAAAMGETGQVYVLDMGEPVRIVDLARDMIRLSGHSVDEIRIVFTGLRPGEKLFEELLADSDTSVPTAIARLSVARLDDADAATVLDWLKGLSAGVLTDDEIRLALRQLVKEFRSNAVMA